MEKQRQQAEKRFSKQSLLKEKVEIFRLNITTKTEEEIHIFYV